MARGAAAASAPSPQQRGTRLHPRPAEPTAARTAPSRATGSPRAAGRGRVTYRASDVQLSSGCGRSAEVAVTAVCHPVPEGLICIYCLQYRCLLHSCSGQTSGVEVSDVKVTGSPLSEAVYTSLEGPSANWNPYLPLVLLWLPSVTCKDTASRLHTTQIKYFISKQKTTRN